MKKAIILFLLCVLMQGACLLSGCRSGPQYTYEEIKRFYEREKGLRSSPRGAGDKHKVGTPQDPISLQHAIKLVIDNNPEIDMAIARIRQSERIIDKALSAFWPVVSTYLEYLQGDAPSAYLFKTIDQRELPPGVDFNDPGWFENYEMGFQARLNLYNGGRDILRKRMAETGLSMSQLDRLSVENALIASTIKAYYNALAAHEYIQVADDSVSTVKAELRIMDVRYRAGGALRSDILSLKVRLAQVQEDLIRAKNNYNLSLTSLANLMGLDPDTPMALEKGRPVITDMPDDYKTGLIYALANRPELKKIRQQLVQSRMALDAARSGYFPRLDFQGKYYFDDSGLDFEENRENWTAGIMMSWELFSGHSTKADMKKTEAFIDEMLALDRNTTNSVQLDLKKAYLKLSEAEARIDVTKASVEQAEESLRLVKKQYEGGSATITRYLDAELARSRAKIRSVAASFDLEKAKADLGRALGYFANRTHENVVEYE